MHFIFFTLDFRGFNVPSIESIAAITAEAPTHNDLLKVIEISNTWVRDKEKIYNPEKFIPNTSGWLLEVLKLHQQIIEIEKEEFGLCGFRESDYAVYAHCRAIASWHESIRGNFQGRGAQDFKKDIGTTIYKLKRKKTRNYKKPVKDFLEYPESSNALEFSMNLELKQACGKVNYFNYIIHDSLAGNYELMVLYLRELEPRKELGKITEKLTAPSSYEYRCPYCFRVSTQTSSEVPKSCDQCEKFYKESWDKANRPRRPTRADAGWNVAFAGNRRNCQDCGEKRQVNNQSECFDCFCGKKNINPENFTGKGF
jgi:hypothetical protein